jgi:hypothetical protein
MPQKQVRKSRAKEQQEANEAPVAKSDKTDDHHAQETADLLAEIDTLLEGVDSDLATNFRQKGGE